MDGAGLAGFNMRCRLVAREPDWFSLSKVPDREIRFFHVQISTRSSCASRGCAPEFLLTPLTTALPVETGERVPPDFWAASCPSTDEYPLSNAVVSARLGSSGRLSRSMRRQLTRYNGLAKNPHTCSACLAAGQHGDSQEAVLTYHRRAASCTRCASGKPPKSMPDVLRLACGIPPRHRRAIADRASDRTPLWLRQRLEQARRAETYVSTSALVQ